MLSFSSVRVFVVDDEPIIASTLAVILKDNGFDTKAYTDPLEALEEAKLQPPHLVISDVVMPGLSGIDLAIEIQQISPNTKILLFSGHASTVDLLEKAREAGYNFTLLTKPVHPADLLQAIQTSDPAAQ
jgi:CheY-like chemotaxis protein